MASLIKDKNILVVVVMSSILSVCLSLNCPKYTCESFTDGKTCSRVTPVNTNGVLDRYDISVELCGGTKFCNTPAFGSWSNTTQSTYSCAEKNYLPLVDREKCSSNSDCASNQCLSGRCTGLPLNAPCSTSSQCQVSLMCDSNLKQCLPQKEVNSICAYDEECVNRAGCYQGKCVEYWNLTDGTNITDSATAEWYCEGGFSYDGKCASFYNLDSLPYTCTDTCNYQIAENNQRIQAPQFCSCGYNSDGLKYCQLGSNSTVWMKYKELSRNVLKQTCQVTKKFTCSNEINYMDIINRQNYYNAFKGKYQLGDQCLISYFSSSNLINYSTYMAYVFALIYLFI